MFPDRSVRESKEAKSERGHIFDLRSLVIAKCGNGS